MEKFHYYLVAGEVAFVDKETREPGGMRLNAVLQTKEPNLGAEQIGKAQQMLQLRFHEKMGEASLTVEVFDVFILSFSSLGHMTQARFQKMPADMVAQTRTVDIHSREDGASGSSLN